MKKGLVFNRTLGEWAIAFVAGFLAAWIANTWYMPEEVPTHIFCHLCVEKDCDVQIGDAVEMEIRNANAQCMVIQ